MMLSYDFNAFAERLERYLEETLHESIRLNALENNLNLPIFLEQTYNFYETLIAGRRCIFLVSDENSATPSRIAKHIDLVRSLVNAIIIFTAPSLSAYNRSNLITRGVAFAVPNNQLYIPELAMELREQFRSLKKLHPQESFSPAAQAVLFHHLLHIDEHATTPLTIATRLRYSTMSIGRAFDELVSFGLAHTEKQGKERHLRFNITRKALFEKSRPFLRSPTRSVKYLRNGYAEPILKRAGESALAELTDLSPPEIEVFAVLATEWKTISSTFNLFEVGKHEADFAVETWSYDPAGLSDSSLVDPLSLYAQFWNHSDERISLAAEKLLEHVIW